MAKTAPFDNCLSEYEQWFDNYYFVYLLEVEAIRRPLPTERSGVEIAMGSGLFASALGITEGCDPSSTMRAKAIERGTWFAEKRQVHYWVFKRNRRSGAGVKTIW